MLTFQRRRAVSLCALFFVVLVCRAAAAQTVTGNITGMVTDPSGGALVGAAVTLVNEKTGESRNVNANEDGRFSFAAVQPGVYTVRVEQKGFQTLERRNTTLSANENLALGELSLPVGQVTEVVTTVASGAVVETESSDLTARLTSDQIALISTKGRDITSLLRLMPGTSNNDDIEGVGDGFGTDLPNVSGQRGRSAVATVDGLNAGEPSGSNKLSMTINQDAVAEVQVLRDNYGAEYGNNGGALINLVSKGGGKDYRGTAYYFIRNEALNASNFFSNKAGLKRPLYRHNIWGFNEGGPLPLPRFGEGGPRWLKDKAFFFFSLEKPHTITPTDPFFVTVPTALERAGDFSQSFNSTGVKVVVNDPLTGLPFAGNVIPAGRLNRSGQALLNYYPLPNASGRTAGGAAYNYVNQQSVDVPKHSYLIRFDLKPSDRDNIYFKAQWWTSDNEGLGTSGWPNGGNGVDRWGISSHYLYTDNGRSANWVHVFGPAVVNEFTFGWRDDTEGFVPSDGFVDGLRRSTLDYTAPQLFPENNTLGLIPRATGWSSVAGNPANIDQLADLIGTALNFPTGLSGVEAASKTPVSYNYTLGIQLHLGHGDDKLRADLPAGHVPDLSDRLHDDHGLHRRDGQRAPERRLRPDAGRLGLRPDGNPLRRQHRLLRRADRARPDRKPPAQRRADAVDLQHRPRLLQERQARRVARAPAALGDVQSLQPGELQGHRRRADLRRRAGQPGRRRLHGGQRLHGASQADPHHLRHADQRAHAARHAGFAENQLLTRANFYCDRRGPRHGARVAAAAAAVAVRTGICVLVNRGNFRAWTTAASQDATT
jgi:hypothetical protein